MKRVGIRPVGDVPEEVMEAYRSLRTNILVGGLNRKVYILTADHSGAGCSTAALHLAAACAETGQKVLFMDADLKHSVLHTRMEAYGQELPGLSRFLKGEAAIEDAVCSTNVQGLYILPPGSIPRNPAELLAGERFRELMEILRKVFDLVLIDTPPAVLSEEAVHAASCADCAILVAEYGVSRGRDAKRAILQLRRSKCPVGGALLLKVKG